ncbi:MAG TPA: hypothetical protein DCZ95_07280 [Verrucomicrobia bacterium]|nr:MAG: hypothetical protein A2X46_13775 [Lentisphaerae bacterium GWF2_57_35]HBA83877.1 hypothetical protein [Verrucomicrobiota bacterium]
MAKNKSLRIGVDFDNTIVNYDGVFHRVAREKNLIPADLPATKGHVRDYLRRIDREDEWTLMQGYVYGARMSDVDMFPGALDFFVRRREWNVPLFIISHKTRTPYMGPSYDLHAAARQWIEANGFLDGQKGGLSSDDVFFELTKNAKFERIAAQQCTLFLDDLPEFLLDPGFPSGVERILFDPSASAPVDDRLRRVTSWAEFSRLVQDRMKDCE